MNQCYNKCRKRDCNMEENLATELLHEVKLQSKRWFTAFIIVLILWFATIGAFLWYISLPIEEYDIDQVSEFNSQNQLKIIGGNNYGETEGEVQTQSEQNP